MGGQDRDRSPGLDQQGLVAVQPSQRGHDPVVVVPAARGATLTAVDRGGDVGQYSSVTIGTDGLGLISYYDATSGDLKVAHCSNSACAVATLTTVDRGGDVGQYSSVTIGTDGLALISYYDATNGDLKVAHCSDLFCVPYHRRR